MPATEAKAIFSNVLGLDFLSAGTALSTTCVVILIDTGGFKKSRDLVWAAPRRIDSTVDQQGDLMYRRGMQLNGLVE